MRQYVMSSFNGGRPRLGAGDGWAVSVERLKPFARPAAATASASALGRELFFLRFNPAPIFGAWASS